MMDLRELLGRLQGVEAKGNGQYMARCPCHDDRKASLAIRMGEKGIVLHCLAGCATEDILQSLGVTVRDITLSEHWRGAKTQDKPSARSKAPKSTPRQGTPPAGGPAKPESKSKVPADLERLRVGGEYVHKTTNEQGQSDIVRERITRCYDYQDAKGRVVLKVFRTEAKSFPVVHLGGDGRWYWGDGGQNDLLYRLPRVLQAVREGVPVWIVEGEKDVETLESLGYVATCNKGGAGKWPETLTKALEGARAVICPDVDEPGRKHGRLVARELEGHAKEVRLINLLRAPGVKLPEKGDVSDLCQQLGTGAKAMLDKLCQSAMVLSRRVSDADYEEYFTGIKGCEVQNGCICTFSGGDWKPLSNFVALPIEEALRDDGNGSVEYQVTVAGWSSLGHRLRTVSMSMETFGRMEWPLALWGLSANVSESNGAKQKLRRIIQAAGMRAAVHRMTYCHTGWRVVDGRLCFLHGGGAIGAEDVDVQLDYGFARYTMEGVREGPMLEMEPALRKVQCQLAAIRAMEVGTLAVGVPLTGFMFLSPLKYFLEQRGHRPSFIPFVRGATQTGKSAYTALLLNYFGYDFGYESPMPANFENTANGISLKMFQLKDLPLLVDDYHPQGEPTKAKAMSTVAESLARMVGDGAIRDRMRADGGAQLVHPVRALCVATGEETPRISPSGVARLYVIDIRDGDVPIPRKGSKGPQRAREEEYVELLKLARQGALNECMKGYIEWLIPQADSLPEKLETKLEELRWEALKRMDASSRGRMATTVSYLMLGIWMMLRYMAEPGGLLTQEDVERSMGKYWDVITGAAERQNQEMRQESPSEVFITTVRELLQSGRCVALEAKEVRTVAPPGVIGYKDERYYYLNPGETFGAVQRSLDAQGTSMALTKPAVLRMLAQEGKLVRDEKANKNVRQYNRGGIHAWMIWIPRHVIDGTQADENVEQLAMDVTGKVANPFESRATGHGTE